MRGRRLREGDRVRLVSPASFPDDGWADQVAATLAGWGLRPELGASALARHGYMAGPDEDRLADLNDALRDPGVRAVVTTTGGAGAYRIVDGIDFDAVRADPKPVVGFSDITNLHLAMWARTGVASIHGCVGTGGRTDESARHLLFDAGPVTVHASPAEPLVPGRASGILIGGLAGAISNFVGAGLPSLAGTIVCLEGAQNPHFDRFLWALRRGGALQGVRGFAIGDLAGLDPAVASPGPESAVEVLSARLGDLGVPILSGLPFGHMPDQVCVPLGTWATIDTEAGTLTAESAVA
ncbi:LD-carboxypeptidase [Actinoplanes sp. NPDC051633]|uniref:S66 peptidase family protein n=1 Tax=Actinoplanes sp. NPDC051633 TaxID=3155670 RepID=UPI00344110F4